jgi:CDP-glucose 4,6-dehydratase
MKNLFGGIYSYKKVLVTGHTGFKGSWLSLWLSLLGADERDYPLNRTLTLTIFPCLILK